jgi:hypothetical protein
LSANDANLDLLRAAIARRAGVVLSLPLLLEDASHEAGAGGAPGPLRHYKSRFLADGGDGLWVADVPAEWALVREVVERRAAAGVSFRSGQLKVMFAAEALHVQADYSSGDGATTGAILLRFPDAGDVRAVPRRRNHRVPVTIAGDLSARLWVMPDDADLRDKPSAKSELHCDVCDVSVAGLGVILHGVDGRAPAARGGERLRVELSLRETTVLLEGRLRYAPRPVPTRPGFFRSGIEFTVLTDSRDDRTSKTQLDGIVSELQCEAIRRKKLGAA